ncbi:MAG: hypothetical protein RHS_1265 [Robinsoniella sp. RHS]|nr:MAG: hypothetical protein RHS_1265 [Robinsoniella sp. RHS]
MIPADSPKAGREAMYGDTRIFQHGKRKKWYSSFVFNRTNHVASGSFDIHNVISSFLRWNLLTSGSEVRT